MIDKKIEKGELHIHLFGGIPSNIIFNILKNNNLEIASESELLVPKTCASLCEYFYPWKYFRKIPCNFCDLDTLIDGFFNNLKKENISFVEVRNSIVHIAERLNIDIVDALSLIDERIQFFSNKYNIKAGLIMTLERGSHMKKNFTQLIDAYKRTAYSNSIIGIDIAGNEDFPIEDNFAANISNITKDNNLGLTVHAGETGNLMNVYQAIQNFKANRIGHGVAALLSEDVLKILHEQNICLEVCPTSNLYTGALKRETLIQLQNLIRFDVPFTICSDNPCIQNSTLGEEYELLSNILGDEFIKNKQLEIQKNFSFIKELR